MSQPKENRYIVKRGDKYLRHEGHNHYWTAERYLAMEYTKLDVAQALAERMGGEVVGI